MHCTRWKLKQVYKLQHRGARHRGQLRSGMKESGGLWANAIQFLFVSLE